MKEKLFGFKGVITPTAVIKDLKETWEQAGISYSIMDGVFEVRYSNRDEKNKALQTAQLYIQSWNFQHDTKLSIDFNHYWEPKNGGGSLHNISLHDSIRFSDRVTTQTITHTLSFSVKAKIIGKSDSASFVANQNMVEKSLKSETLRKALQYYAEEVVDEKRPLYGIYKAIEVIVEELRGKNKKKLGIQALAQKAHCSDNYIEDVLETTQIQRHAITRSRPLLTDQECRSRAKELISAYAKTI